MELKGKTALVTGAAKRVGRQIALDLARQGVDILLHFNTSKAEAQKTAAEIRALGVNCGLFKADLCSVNDISKMARQIKNHPVVPDILINSASVFYKTPLADVKESDWETLSGSNLKGPFFLSKEIGLKMFQGKGGKIINIADWSGFRPYKNYAPYCASKGGLITLTKALAKDLSPKVMANAIAPGPVLLPENFSEEEKQKAAGGTLLGRVGSPQDVAHAVIFLLENDFINGTLLVVDGGRSIV